MCYWGFNLRRSLITSLSAESENNFSDFANFTDSKELGVVKVVLPNFSYQKLVT